MTLNAAHRALAVMVQILPFALMIAAGGMLAAVFSQTAPHALRRASLAGFAQSAGAGFVLVGLVHWSVAFLSA
ncbi:MAG: hypothetical protein AABX97_01275 [Candidatus Thermoplasmatota archaeon]